MNARVVRAADTTEVLLYRVFYLALLAAVVAVAMAMVTVDWGVHAPAVSSPSVTYAHTQVGGR